MAFTLPFYFLFFLNFIFPCLSPHCLSISSFFLHKPFFLPPQTHRRSAQAQPPQTPLSPLFLSHFSTRLKSEHFVSLCTHFVSIEKDQATPLAMKSGSQYQLGLDSSVKTVKSCPLAQVLLAGTESDRVLGMGFGLAVLIFLGFCFVLLHWF